MEGGSSTNVQRPHDSLRGSPSNTQGPVSNSRYPLRMPYRLGCSMLGCSVSKQDSESSYCCDSHREMAASMDSSASGVPCIIFDGLKNFDVALCSSLLHRTVDGIAVGVPTISNGIFSVPPWELGAEFNTPFLPAEGCRDLVFFIKEPPEEYPVMVGTSCSWEQRSYHEIELNQDTVTLIRNYLDDGNGQDLEDQYAIWELFRYSHDGVYLFCLSYNPRGSTIKRTDLPIEDRGVEVRTDNTLSSALLKRKDLNRERGQRKRSIKQWGSNLDKFFLKRKRGQRKRSIKQWGINLDKFFLKQTPGGMENEADQVEGIEADQLEGIQAMRAYVNNLMEEAVNNENLDQDTRYRVQALRDSTMSWFDNNEDADIAALREKVAEAEVALQLTTMRNL